MHWRSGWVCFRGELDLGWVCFCVCLSSCFRLLGKAAFRPLRGSSYAMMRFRSSVCDRVACRPLCIKRAVLMHPVCINSVHQLGKSTSTVNSKNQLCASSGFVCGRASTLCINSVNQLCESTLCINLVSQLCESTL